MFCKNCGNKLDDNDKVCAVCGEVVASSAHDQTPETAPETQPEELNEDPKNLPVDEDIKTPLFDFKWNVQDFPKEEPKKTEDIDFKWEAPESDTSVAVDAPEEIPETPVVEKMQSAVDAEEIQEVAPFSEEVEKTEPITDDWYEPFSLKNEPDDKTIFRFNKRNEEFQELLDREYEKYNASKQSGALGTDMHTRKYNISDFQPDKEIVEDDTDNNVIPKEESGGMNIFASDFASPFEKQDISHAPELSSVESVILDEPEAPITDSILSEEHVVDSVKTEAVITESTEPESDKQEPSFAEQKVPEESAGVSNIFDTTVASPFGAFAPSQAQAEEDQVISSESQTQFTEDKTQENKNVNSTSIDDDDVLKDLPSGDDISDVIIPPDVKDITKTQEVPTDRIVGSQNSERTDQLASDYSDYKEKSADKDDAGIADKEADLATKNVPGFIDESFASPFGGTDSSSQSSTQTNTETSAKDNIFASPFENTGIASILTPMTTMDQESTSGSVKETDSLDEDEVLKDLPSADEVAEEVVKNVVPTPEPSKIVGPEIVHEPVVFPFELKDDEGEEEKKEKKSPFSKLEKVIKSNSAPESEKESLDTQNTTIDKEQEIKSDEEKAEGISQEETNSDETKSESFKREESNPEVKQEEPKVDEPKQEKVVLPQKEKDPILDNIPKPQPNTQTAPGTPGTNVNEAQKTKANETPPVSRVKINAEEYNVKHGMSAFSKLITVVIIFVLVLAAGFGVMKFAPNSMLGIIFNNVFDKTISGDSTGQGAQVAPTDDINSLIESAKSINKNIGQIEYDESAKYDETASYPMGSATSSQPIQNNFWKESSGGDLLFDEQAVKTVIGYNSSWVDYVNSESRDVFSFVVPSSSAEVALENEKLEAGSKAVYNKLGIGEIRQNGNLFYVWTVEVITINKGGSDNNAATIRQLYELEAGADSLKITNIVTL